MADVDWAWIQAVDQVQICSLCFQCSLDQQATWGIIFVLRAKAPEVLLDLTSTFQAAAYAISANLSLDKASQMNKAEAGG